MTETHRSSSVNRRSYGHPGKFLSDLTNDVRRTTYDATVPFPAIRISWAVIGILAVCVRFAVTPEVNAETSRSERFTLESGGVFGGGSSVQGGSMQFTVSVVGETMTAPPPTLPASSAAFEVLGGFVASVAADGVIPVRQYDIEWLRAKTSVTGATIVEKTWQVDNDPFFYWSTPGGGLDVVGYSFALDAIPDQLIDAQQTSYQYPTDGMLDGRYTFSVMAQNTASNWGNPKSFELWVDTQPPATSGLSPTNGAILSENQPSIEVTLLDAYSGVDPNALRMTLDGRSVSAQFDPQSGRFLYAPSARLSDGQTTVRVDGADAVGNAITPLIWSFMIDTVKPNGTVVINARFDGDLEGETETNTIYVTLTVGAEDATSGVVSMRVWNDDGSEPTTWESVRGVVADWALQPVDGARIVYIRLLDAAGNVSDVASDTIQLAIDAPETWITGGPSGVVAEADATFTFQSSDLAAVYQYRFDDEPWPGAWSSTASAARSGLTSGNHYFTVKSAADADGSGVIEPDEEDPTPAQRTWTVVAGDGVAQPVAPEQPVKYWRQE